MDTLEPCDDYCNMTNFWERVVDCDRNQMFREFISDTIA